MFSPNKKMSIILLLAVLVISLLLSFYVPQLEGLETAEDIVNKDAPPALEPGQTPDAGKPTLYGINIPQPQQKNKILTVDEITKVLGANPGVQKMLAK
jgi:hypothetical protein